MNQGWTILVVTALWGAQWGCEKSPPVGTTTVTTQTETQTKTAHGIAWREWGPDVFELALKEDKLILFDSGATWCHWCHVMDRVTYENDEVIRLVNQKFIPVRIDRDRLPDVDAYYQRAVAVFDSRGGGWPLTVVISPEGHTLFKATFVPPHPDPRYGARMGLIELLQTVDKQWRENREQINAAAEQIRTQVAQSTRAALSRPGELSDEKVEEILAGVKDSFDPVHGGFGGAPKFFGTSAIELLLARGWAGDETARKMALQTLESIARGGVYDHVGGGFHRYSVDARWHVPHFEKMAYDNGPLLTLYADAYALTGREEFARVAREIITWANRDLSAPKDKGFLASQDADVGLDDDGDYFTWTVDEVTRAVGRDAKTVLAWYGVDTGGDMHERPGRNVLHVTRTLEEFATEHGGSAGTLRVELESAREKLLAVRAKRQAPGIDKTVFADLNGMLIDGYLTAHERLGDAGPRDKAIRVLDHLLDTLRDRRGVFAHFRDASGLRKVGMLADQAWMTRALVHAYRVTGQGDYLDAAGVLGDYILKRLTAEDGGLLTVAKTDSTGPAVVEPTRSWDDAPVRSAASVAAQTLIDLAYLTGKDEYAAAGVQALGSFAEAAGRRWGTFLGGYAVATDHHVNGSRTILVVGPAGEDATQALAAAARRAYVPGATVLSLDPARSAHAKRIEQLGYAAQDRPVAYVCRGKVCLAPVYTPEELAETVAQLGRRDDGE